jgi:hypothetical protein
MSLPFFRNQNTQENNYYDDGPTPPPKNIDPGSFRSGIETLKIDGYRQGVEITQLRHWDAGIVKIHAGEPGHILRKNRFGMDRNPIIPNSWCQDLDNFNPVRFIQVQEEKSYLFGGVFTFPIVVDYNDRGIDNVHDGIIEPLTIRSVAGFYSLETPFIAHDTKGDMMAGTSRSSIYGSSQILQIDEFDTRHTTVGFLDLVSRYESYFNTNENKLNPFNDVDVYPQTKSYKMGVWDEDMLLAILSMTGSSTDNYISTKQRSSTAGWDYDFNTVIGTDSIAFGGMTY